MLIDNGSAGRSLVLVFDRLGGGVDTLWDEDDDEKEDRLIVPGDADKVLMPGELGRGGTGGRAKAIGGTGGGLAAGDAKVGMGGAGLYFGEDSRLENISDIS